MLFFFSKVGHVSLKIISHLAIKMLRRSVKSFKYDRLKSKLLHCITTDMGRAGSGSAEKNGGETQTPRAVVPFCYLS